MIDLLPIVQARFALEPSVQKYWRGVFESGAESGRPRVEMAIVASDSEFDSFDADIERMDVEFRLFSNTSQSARVHAGVKAFRTLFDDADLSGTGFAAGMFRFTGGGPIEIVDGVYQTTLGYEGVFTLDALTPLVREV